MDMKKKKDIAADEYPEFFNVFLPNKNAQRMRIPTSFVKCLRGRVLEKAILKSPKGRLWHVDVCNINGDGMYFNKGWEKFIKDNTFEVGYFVTFSFDGSNTFKFKIYDTSCCERIEAYKEEVKEEEKYFSEEEEEEEGDDDDDEDEDEEEEEEEEEEDTDVEEEKGEQVKHRRSRKRQWLSFCSSIGGFGIDAETYVQPDNPYFLTKVEGNRKNELHIPTVIIHDFSIRLQEGQRIRLRRCCKRLPKHEVQAHHHHQQEEVERQDRSKCEKENIEGEVIKWKDGRLCIKNWAKFWRRNRIHENDVCLCEFLLGDDRQTDTLVVHIVGSA